jgi:hypothetical protein
MRAREAGRYKLRGRLPEILRLFEVVVIGVFGLVGTLYFLRLDSGLRDANNKLLAQQISIQNDFKKLLEDKSQVAILTALAPYLTCNNKDDVRNLAIGILQKNAMDQLNAALPLIAGCGRSATGAPNTDTIDLNKIRTESNLASIELEFARRVNIGRQYYQDDLWLLAARTWYDAMNHIPQWYVDNHLIDLSEVGAARSAFDSADYTKAADLYRTAYQRVSTR